MMIAMPSSFGPIHSSECRGCWKCCAGECGDRQLPGQSTGRIADPAGLSPEHLPVPVAGRTQDAVGGDVVVRTACRAQVRARAFERAGDPAGISHGRLVSDSSRRNHVDRTGIVEARTPDPSARLRRPGDRAAFDDPGACEWSDNPLASRRAGVLAGARRYAHHHSRRPGPCLAEVACARLYHDLGRTFSGCLGTGRERGR